MKRFFWCLLFCLVFLPLPAFGETDSDGDGLSDELEKKYYTNPLSADTDGDGFSDKVEIDSGYSPLLAGGKKMGESDFDKDGLHDWLELWFGSDIGVKDTDRDGRDDFDEVLAGFSPKTASTNIRFNRRIEVDLNSQRLYFYVDKVKILNLPVSTGTPLTPTPSGNFSIMRKVGVKRYLGQGFDYPNTLWNMEFKRGFYIHGAYWHNDFGRRTRSHGCVNMKTADAGLIYPYVDVGMSVRIIGKTPSGYLAGL